MPYLALTNDLTQQYKSFERQVVSFRAVAGLLFPPGTVVKFAPQDAQVYPDEKTIQLPGTGAAGQSILGVVSETWNGFGGSVAPGSYLSPSATARGSSYVDVVTSGPHPAILVDQSGTGAVTIVDGLPLVPSRATVGYAQGITTALGAIGTVAVATLPGSGLGSSITAAALAQAAQTITLTGTPAAGDTISFTVQSNYIAASPGIAQTTTYTIPALTSAQAASVTTAAAAFVAYLNSVASFSANFIATNAAGVVTITVLSTAGTFHVNYSGGPNGQIANEFDISISGMVANSLTFAASSTGGTTATAGGTTFAGGTGFKGYLPGYIV